MAATPNKSLTLLTIVLNLAVQFWNPCNSVAINPRSRWMDPSHQDSLDGDDANKISQEWQPAPQQPGNTQEINVYLPAGVPQGSIQGPPDFKSQDSTPDTQPVAFSAHRLKGLTVSTGARNITYDKEELDLTNSFEHTKGYFHCQIPGLYYFSFSFWARSSTPLKLGLKQNGRTKAALFIGRGTLLEQASQTAILLLKRGDRVWLEAMAPSIITSSMSPINIFNGYLIQPITSNYI